jgi:hypothetical protein
MCDRLWNRQVVALYSKTGFLLSDPAASSRSLRGDLQELSSGMEILMKRKAEIWTAMHSPVRLSGLKGQIFE